MRLIDAIPLECQAKECKENEWNQRVAPVSWAHAEERFLSRIEDAPTVDAVPVVRCKGCKYSCRDRNGRICEGYWYELSEFAVQVEDDGFCSYGERKEG